MSINIGEVLLNLWQKSGFNAIFVGFADGGWQNLVMLIIACVLLYLGIVKKFEPLLLVGIAFGCLLSNLPLGGLYHQELWDNFMNPASDLYHSYGAIMREGGLLGGNVMCKLTGGKVNPLIGSAGVSAVPMAARVSNTVGQKNNPSNFLLMHAMGPNVAGVIGSAIAAGFLLSVFG